MQNLIFLIPVLLIHNTIGQGTDFVRVDLYKCDPPYNTLDLPSCSVDPRTASYDTPRNVTLKLCQGCRESLMRVNIYHAVELETCCHNPPYGEKWQSQRKKVVAATEQKVTSDGPDSYPGLVCRWSPFSTNTNCERKFVQYVLQEVRKCSARGCLHDGEYCKGRCGEVFVEPLGSFFQGEVTCFVTSGGVMCPTINHAVDEMGDTWGDVMDGNKAWVSPTEFSMMLKGIVYQDAYVKSIVETSLKRHKYAECMLARNLYTLASVNKTLLEETYLGLSFYQGQLVRKTCINSTGTVGVIDGYWMIDGWFVNPWTAEILPYKRESWKNAPLSQGDRVLHQDGYVKNVSIFNDQHPILSSSFGMTRVLEQMNDIITDVPIIAPDSGERILSSNETKLMASEEVARVAWWLILWLIILSFFQMLDTAILGVNYIGQVLWRVNRSYG